MKNYLTISVAALFFAVGIAIVASSNAAAIDFVYCLAPEGSVRAISTSYTSDCSGLAAPGSREINETRAKALFEEERMRALGLGTGAQAADDPSIKGQMRTDIQAAMTTHINYSLLDGKYVVFDGMDGKVMRLTYDALHKGIVHKGEFFVSCADFRDAAGTRYDLDLLVAETDDGYRVMQTVVHKVGDDERKYTVEQLSWPWT